MNGGGRGIGALRSPRRRGFAACRQTRDSSTGPAIPIYQDPHDGGPDIWRWERDSNPRYPRRYNGFRDRPVQPLRHPTTGAFWRRIPGKQGISCQGRADISPSPLTGQAARHERRQKSSGIRLLRRCRAGFGGQGRAKGGFSRPFSAEPVDIRGFRGILPPLSPGRPWLGCPCSHFVFCYQAFRKPSCMQSSVPVANSTGSAKIRS